MNSNGLLHAGLLNADTEDLYSIGGTSRVSIERYAYCYNRCSVKRVPIVDSRNKSRCTPEISHLETVTRDTIDCPECHSALFWKTITIRTGSRE
jgi:hypothetical protein